jgi:spore coat protein CotH
MIRHRFVNVVVALAVIGMVALLGTLMFAYATGAIPLAHAAPYAESLFSNDQMHEIDIVVDENDWNDMIANAQSEEYILADVVIDGEKVSGVGIRPKGNSSLATIARSDSERYSFKIEFDHYVDGRSYQGLDKLALNNIAQDNTLMKDYVTYHMMNEMGANAPLSSFIWITVNGEDWGLYLAVEGIEESFALRTHGNTNAQIYKPDSMDMNEGGGFGGGAPEGVGGFGEGDAPEGFGGFGGDVPEGEWMPEMPEGDMPAMDGVLPAPPNTAEEGIAEEDAVAGDVAESDVAESGAAEVSDDQAPIPSEGQMPGPGGRGGGRGAMAPGAAIPSVVDGEGTVADPGADGIGMAGPGAGGMGMGDMGSGGATALIYTDDSPDSYAAIFDNAVFDTTKTDRARLIASLKQMNAGENIEEVVNVDEVLRYFAVHNFVLNSDSYTGNLTHNYYLYEEDGQLSMVAWDYNLAFGGMGGMGDMGGTGDNATLLVNYPVDSPMLTGSVEDKPMIAWIFADEDYLSAYHEVFSEYLEYFESGAFAEMYDSAIALIAPYVQRDPSSFVTYEDFEKGAATLREFCLLRAESIRGQLDGQIPATSEAQAIEPEKLIDASGIDLTSMGNSDRGFDRAR